MDGTTRHSTIKNTIDNDHDATSTHYHYYYDASSTHYHFNHDVSSTHYLYKHNASPTNFLNASSAYFRTTSSNRPLFEIFLEQYPLLGVSVTH